MHPAINWIISKANLVRLRVFILIFHHLVLILHFELYIKFNFVLISVLNQFWDTNFLPFSNFD